VVSGASVLDVWHDLDAQQEALLEPGTSWLIVGGNLCLPKNTCSSVSLVCFFGVFLWCVSLVCFFGVFIFFGVFLWCVSLVCFFDVLL
jgi:hypothetical protein